MTVTELHNKIVTTLAPAEGEFAVLSINQMGFLPGDILIYRFTRPGTPVEPVAYLRPIGLPPKAPVSEKKCPT